MEFTAAAAANRPAVMKLTDPESKEGHVSPFSHPRLAVSPLAAAKKKLAGTEKWLAVSQPSCHKVEIGTAGLQHQLGLRAHISPNQHHLIVSNFFFFFCYPMD